MFARLTELFHRKQPSEMADHTKPTESASPMHPEVAALLQTLHEVLPQCQLLPSHDQDLDKTGLLALEQQSHFFQILITHVLEMEKRQNEAKTRNMSPLGAHDYLQEMVSSTRTLCDDSERNFVADLLLDLIKKEKGEKPTSQILHHVPLFVWNNLAGKYEPLGIEAQTVLRKSTVGKNAAMIVEGEGTGLLLHFSSTDGCYSVDRFWHSWHSQAKMLIGDHELTSQAERGTIQAGLAEVTKLDKQTLNILIMLLQAVHGKSLDLSHLHHS